MDDFQNFALVVGKVKDLGYLFDYLIVLHNINEYGFFLTILVVLIV